ncbi:MAG: large subunit ribosomal protein L11 [archaeon GW2011_AR3]|nr:MAG: large subunit ribosomal protein L11 [archaeon GW2011_AR3]
MHIAKEKVEALVEGGKATAAPPLGPALGPLGVNIGKVVADINKKTESFKGMQVPVKITVDTSTKEYEISIGTPPASALVKKEANIEKGSGNPLLDLIADIKIEQIIKIAKMKEDSLLGKTMKEKVKEIIGTCGSMGVMVEGVTAKAAIKLVDEGKFDEEIKLQKTELSAAELKELEEEKKKLAEEILKRREEFVKKAKEIIAANEGKERGFIKGKLGEAKIPQAIIDELLPAEAAGGAAAAPGAPGAAPAKEAVAKAAPAKK